MSIATLRGLLIAAIFACAGQTAMSQNVDFESKYLNNKVAGFHGYHITFELTGNVPVKGKLALDPNACGLNGFGDRTICTRIAISFNDVNVTELRVFDPTGQKRRAFQITGHGLSGDLRLITTTSLSDGWFVLTARNNVNTIIDLDPVRRATSPESPDASPGTAKACLPLPCTVDGTAAQYKVVPGFVNETWILLLKGKKRNGGTTVDFAPRVYVKRPDYWAIDISECSDGITIPVITPYDEHFEVTEFLGHKGIELVFADKKVRIEVGSVKKGKSSKPSKKK